MRKWLLPEHIEDVLPAEGRVIERLRRAILDLFETHGTRAAFERDRLRHEELKLLGIEMIRVTRPRLLREPEAVLANLAALLDRRRRELSAFD